MEQTILDTFFVIKNIRNKKFMRFVTDTKEQLEMELEVEFSIMQYSNGLFTCGHHQAVKIREENDAKKIFGWLNELIPNEFELLKIIVEAEKIA